LRDRHRQQGANFSHGAQYFSRFVPEEILLFDANNDPIPQWTLTDLVTSHRVFCETGRLAPVGPAPDLPEPATLALLGRGVANPGFSRPKP
jgi:hypothetical protein